MKAADALRHLLESTRDEEVDCDRFLELLPSLLDGLIDDPALREKLAHHVRQCAECREELEIVKRALDLSASPRSTRRGRGDAHATRAKLLCMERDTSAAASARYHELLRAQPPHQRLAQAMALSRTVRELAIAGLRQRHPDASDDEIRMRLAVRLYGRAHAERLFGALPIDAV